MPPPKIPCPPRHFRVFTCRYIGHISRGDLAATADSCTRTSSTPALPHAPVPPPLSRRRHHLPTNGAPPTTRSYPSPVAVPPSPVTRSSPLPVVVPPQARHGLPRAPSSTSRSSSCPCTSVKKTNRDAPPQIHHVKAAGFVCLRGDGSWIPRGEV
ncbi:hypothetical protein ZWY2020_025313 [Hordeum vulgare]|nr:hypothetical protein ZWY2020_025313 [Hordeum vulgare]